MKIFACQTQQSSGDVIWTVRWNPTMQIMQLWRFRIFTHQWQLHEIFIHIDPHRGWRM